MRFFNSLRSSKRVTIVEDEKHFWRFCKAKQRFGNTPDEAAAMESELDLRCAESIKELLECEAGPEEGSNPVQMQNWDWNDDRTRDVYILRRVFRADLIEKLQSILVSEFEDYSVVVIISDSWDSGAWGHLWLSKNSLTIQRNVAEYFCVATAR